MQAFDFDTARDRFLLSLKIEYIALLCNFEIILAARETTDFFKEERITFLCQGTANAKLEEQRSRNSKAIEQHRRHVCSFVLTYSRSIEATSIISTAPFRLVEFCPAHSHCC